MERWQQERIAEHKVHSEQIRSNLQEAPAESSSNSETRSSASHSIGSSEKWGLDNCESIETSSISSSSTSDRHQPLNIHIPDGTGATKESLEAIAFGGKMPERFNGAERTSTNDPERFNGAERTSTNDPGLTLDQSLAIS